MGTFGSLLYELRKEKGLTQSELADKLGLTDKTISRWENDESFPETGKLVPLSKIFNITVDELLNGKRDLKNEDGRIKKMELPEIRPLSRKQLVQIFIGIIFVIAALVQGIVLIERSSNSWYEILLFPILVGFGVMLFINAGMNYSLATLKLPKNAIRKAQIDIWAIAIGVFAFIVGLSAYFIFEDNLTNILIMSAVALTIGMGLTIFGGHSWFHKTQKYMNDLKATRMQYYEKSNIEMAGTINAIMWMLVPAIYLVLGFVFDLWHPGWIIFPIAGILSGVFELAFSIKK